MPAKPGDTAGEVILLRDAESSQSIFTLNALSFEGKKSSFVQAAWKLNTVKLAEWTIKLLHLPGVNLLAARTTLSLSLSTQLQLHSGPYLPP